MGAIHDGHREKMRRRFLNSGLESFADHEALELLLYYAIPRRDTNPIAHALMERYGSLSAVLSAPVEDLKKVEGIGESGAVLLRLVPQLYRKARLAEAEQETVLSSIERVGAYLLDRFEGSGTRWSTSCAWTERAVCWPASGWGKAASPLRSWTSAG